LLKNNWTSFRACPVYFQLEIEKIEKVITDLPEEFENVIDDLLMNLDKSRLLSITGDCGRVIEVLRLAFR
jgi:hypothetical protein